MPIHFNFLYQDAVQRQVRKEKIYKKAKDKECTFKPRLVSKQEDLLADKAGLEAVKVN